ncbi:MAG: thermitase, partial [Solirubrobacteraceae bacterium]|nr:thermitase [Solirubrobacteraceae bacterium]
MRLPGCCTLALVAALAFAPPAHAHAIVPGRVLVGFSSRADAGSRAASRSAAGARLVRHVGRAQLLAVPRGEVRAAVRELRGRRGVRYAQPDYVGHVAVVPDDAYYTAQQWNMAKIGMPAAWDVTTGSPAVKLAILDTGIDLDHPELAGQIDTADGYDVVDGDATPDDPPDATKAIGHGTHVAGIAGALGDNALGVAGVSWDSSLIALRVCGKDGTCAASAIADGITRAGAAGARVANLSIDGLGPSTAVSDAIAGAPGTLFVVSAGNGDRNVDTTPDYPCSFPAPNLVCVAASDEDDALQSRSNWGADSVDLAAPGNAIWSTVTGGGYGSKTGTSMASPHVAGAAALLWADAPTATVAQVRGALLGSVDPTGAPVATGGRLDVAAALQALPGVVIDSGPADGSSSQLASVGFHAAPSGTAFECRFDDAPAFSPCTSPYDASAAADGPHTLDVRAVTGGVTVRRAWTLDRVAPTVTLSDAPSGTLPRRRATVAFETAGDPASVRCSIDGAAFEDCISPLSPAGLADGPHTVEVQATDAAGNAGSAAAAWSVDAAPLTVIGDHPAA